MPDLISYLEKNGFYPRREDIEAILRRLDHDANRMLSYDEFCELASVQDREQEKKEDDFIQDDSKTDLRRANSGDAFNSPAPKDGEVQEEEEGEEQKTAEQKKIGASKAGKKSTAPAKALKPEQTPARSAAKRPATSEDRKRREDSEKAAAEERQALQQSIEDEKQRLQEEAEQRERDLIEAQEKREREW